MKGLDKKSVNNLFRRLEKILPPDSSNDYKAEDGSSANGANWDLINSTIEQHPNDPWYIPKEGVYNAWTSLIHGPTLGNISLRDFVLERKFFNMRSERVEKNRLRWEKARDTGDKEYLAAHIDFGLDCGPFWEFTQEEIDYYSNVDRFPILKTQEKQGFPLWDKRNPIYEANEKMRLQLNKVRGFL